MAGLAAAATFPDDVRDGLVVDQREEGLISRGSYGEIRRGTFYEAPVAVKTLLERGERREFVEEINKMCTLRHPNILRCIGAFTMEDETLALVTELGDFDLGHIDAVRTAPDFLRKAVNWLREAARGLVFMHEGMRMVHGDVKPANILIKNDVALLSKFSFTLTEEEVRRATRMRGTPMYVSPEVWQGHTGTPADVYAFGMTMFVVLFGINPYQDVASISEIRDAVLNGRRPSFEGIRIEYPANLRNLIEDCWGQDPARRPNMRTVYARLTEIHNGL